VKKGSRSISNGETTGLDVAARAKGSPRSRQWSAATSRAKSIIVFYGDAQQVSDGFALALDAIEAHADLLIMDTEPVPKED
jgi:hypothetical protein